ncbi:5'-nucleotidase domain-containing protein 4 isoform X3 [Tanacetum coccineum]
MVQNEPIHNADDGTPMMRLGQFSKKMDRHTYVKVAYHGFTLLSKDEKVATYGNTLVRDAFDEPDYALIDTLFSLVEAYLFAQLVDFKDNNPGKILEENE